MPHPLDFNVVGAAVAELVGALFVLAVLLGLRRAFPRGHIDAWSLGWLAGTLSAVLGLLSAGWLVLPAPLAIVFRLAALLAVYLQAVWLLVGTDEFIRSASPPPMLLRGAPAAALLLAVASMLALGFALPATTLGWVESVLPRAVLGAAALGAALFVFGHLPAPPALGNRLVGGALALYGSVKIYEGVATLAWIQFGRRPAGAAHLGFADLAILGLLGLGTVVALLEDEHRVALRAVRERTESELELAAGRDRLRLSEEKFAKVFRNSPDSISISTLEEGRYLDVNEGFQQLFGYAPSEVIGKTALEMGIWPSGERRAEWVGRLREQGSVRDLETELLTKSREKRLCSLAAEVIRLGDTDCVVSTARDVTDRRQAEERLRESEERWRRISEAAFEGIGISDDGRIVDVNAQLAAMLGCSPPELLGRPVLDFVAPEHRDLVQRMRTDVGEAYDHLAIRKDGSTFPVETRTRPVTYKGRQLRMTAIRDVSGRVRLEADLRRAAREWQKSFDALGVGIAILDHEGRLRRLNRVGLATLGRDNLDDLDGRFLRELGPNGLWRMLAHAGLPDRSRSASVEMRDAAGRSWLVGASALPREAGEPDWTILHFRDVTETTRLREELQRRETLSAVGALVTGVAHEVRTPLFSISATLDAYEGQLASPAEREEFLALLRSQVRRLTNLMTDLLEYAKPSALSRARGGISPIIDNAVRSCAALAREAGIDVVEDVPAHLVDVERDPGRLEQVFQNLLANAVQHAPPGTTVRVAARPGADGIVCTVEDEGRGLLGEDLERVFEPFFSRRRGGTGLGLSIVRRIVEEHGGTVTAGNRPEGGAVFTLVLPAAEAPPLE